MSDTDCLANQTSQQPTERQRRAAQEQEWRERQAEQQRQRDAYLTARLSNTGT